MEPGSRVGDPAERSNHPLANVIGTLIALLTLAVPMAAIAHFSSNDSPSWRPPTQLFLK